MKNKPLLSIITPIYNTEKYLPQCIESILNSSYENFELFLIDDGSTDSCRTIIQNYAQQDSRIRPIYLKQNSGNCNFPRHIALQKYAKGEYIMNIDSDDTIHPNMLEYRINFAQENGLDLVYGSILKTRRSETMEDSILDKPFKQGYFKEPCFITGSMQSKELALKCIFPYHLIYEDNFLNGYWLLNSKRAGIVYRVQYEYTVRPDSICHSRDPRIEGHRELCIKMLWQEVQKVYGDRYDRRFITLLHKPEGRAYGIFRNTRKPLPEVSEEELSKYRFNVFENSMEE